MYTPHAAYDRVVAALGRYEDTLTLAVRELLAGVGNDSTTTKADERIHVTLVVGFHRLHSETEMAKSKEYIEIIRAKFKSRV